MRITSVLVAFLASAALVVMGCGIGTEPESTPEPDSTSDQVPSSQAGQVTEPESAKGICLSKWTCGGPFYGTKAACTAACGGDVCFRDFDCNGTCTCP